MADEGLKDLIISIRDSGRPDIETVVQVLDGLFAELPELRIRAQMRGPDTWTWIDPGNLPGREKYYSIARSVLPGAEGHPLLTIRQVVAPNLDSFVTFSVLVEGPGRNEILRSVNSAFIYHAGGYNGTRSTMTHLVASGGNIVSALLHALNIGSEQQELSLEDVLRTVGDTDAKEMN